MNPLIEAVTKLAACPKEVAKQIKGPELTVQTGMEKAKTPEKKKAVLAELREKKAEAFIEGYMHKN